MHPSFAESPRSATRSPRTRHHRLTGGSCVAHLILWTQHTWVLTRRGSATLITSLSSTASGQVSRDYTNCVRCTTCSHVGSIAPDKKLSVYHSRVSYYLLSPHPNPRGLHNYIIRENSPNTGGCAITPLPQLYSVTW
jgi:hypothetical protein